MIRLRLFFRILSVFLSFVSAAAGFAQQNVDKIAISILKGPSGIGSAWMMENPPTSAGVKFEFMTAGSADIVVAKLISGEIDAGVLPLNVAAKLYNAGVPIKALAVVGNGMVKFLTIDPSIKNLSDIRGKEINIAGQKATPDYLFRFLAEKENLKAGSDYLAVYNLAYPEIAAQLAAGKISSAVLPEPFATQALLLNRALASPIDLDSLWTQKTGLESYPMSLLVISKRFAAGHPEAAIALSAAYGESIRKVLADPAATGKIAESLDLGMTAAVARIAIPSSAYVYIPAPEARKSIEAFLGIFLAYDAQSIGARLPGPDFYQAF